MTFPPHAWNNYYIRVREADGYVCLTDIYKATNREMKPGVWLSGPSGRCAIHNVQRDTGLTYDELIETKSLQTWTHHTLAWCYATSFSKQYADYLHSLVKDTALEPTPPPPTDTEANLTIAERLVALYNALGGPTPAEREYLQQFLPEPPEPHITVRQALQHCLGVQPASVTIVKAGQEAARAFREEFDNHPEQRATEVINGVSVQVNTYPTSWIENHIKSLLAPADPEP